MDLELKGNVALVTASTSGLGKASAKTFAAHDTNVVINGRDADSITEAVDEISAVGSGRVIGHQADLTEKEDIEGLVKRTRSEFGRLDHLVTSAGGPPSGPFLSMEDEDWYHAFDLLVMSVVRVVREAADALCADGGGTIVTITSRSVKEAIDSLVLSNSVRMSVIGLEKTLSTELAPDVRSNAVLPGPHETKRIQSLVEQGIERGDYDSYEVAMQDRSSGIPLGHIGDPADFGNVVAFLSSPAAAHINGVAIPVDGGASASNL